MKACTSPPIATMTSPVRPGRIAPWRVTRPRQPIGESGEVMRRERYSETTPRRRSAVEPVGIRADAFATVQRGDRRAVGVVERHDERVQVLPDALGRHGL